MRATTMRLLCGALIGTALGGPAAAGEQLVMPFACHVAGGQVRLAPSEPRAYPIYGERAQKRLTTCSPYDSSRCHTWSVHRFDLDCGGVRTSWPAVVAALSPILAESVGTPGDTGPYGAPDFAARRPSPGAIAFPGGFAPNPMRVARFEQVDVAPANVPLPPKKPERTVVAEMAPDVEPATEAPNADAETPAETAPAETEPAKTAPAAEPGKDKDSGKPMELAQERVLQIEVDAADNEVTGALPKQSSGALWRDAGLVFILIVAALLALSATLLMRRGTLEALPAWAARRLAGPPRLPAPSRASVVARTAMPHETATPHEQTTRREHATASEQRNAPATRLRLWDEHWLPATTSEALDVLGVDPAAGRDKIKSTVTRLRRALHPDHAFDDEDRDLRERRLKQINVAWELVSRQRRAPWLATKPRASSWPWSAAGR